MAWETLSVRRLQGLNSNDGMFLMSDFIKMTHILIKCMISSSWVFSASG